MRKLSIHGLRKVLPMLEEIAEEHYSDCGGINIRLGMDGELRIDTDNPLLMIEEMRLCDLEMIYAGRDKYGEHCYHICDVMNEELTSTTSAATPAPATGSAPATAAAQSPTAQPPSPEDTGRAGQEEMQKQLMQQISQQVMQQLGTHVDTRMKEFQKQFTDQMDKFGKNVADIN